VVNAIVMIGGSYLGLFMLGHYLLSKVNGWEGVYDWYQSQGTVDMLQSFSIGNSSMWFNIIIPVTVLHCAACAVSQNMNGPFFAAKSEEDCRKGMFVGVFFNCLASVPWIIMALIAAIPAVTEAIGLTGNPDAAKLAPIALAVNALPAPIVGLLMVSLLCATLSTGGATVMANANLMANDIFKTSSNAQLNDKQKVTYVKLFVIISTLLFAVPAFLNAVIFPLFLWCFSFGIPVFAVYFLGLKVKISKKAAWVTVIIAYIVNCWWTFLPIPSWATGPLSLNMYPVTIVTIVVALITTAIFPGEPGLLKRSSMAELGAKDA
jgi:SSS family solute:Na+ symporter